MAKNPNAESYILLLKTFSSDEETATDAYLKLRNLLVKFLQIKGDDEPEESADETLDRVAAKIGANVLIEDLTKYSFGVARLVFLENLRKSANRKKAFENFQAEYERLEITEESDDFKPFRECFESLPDTDKNILRDYFEDLPNAELNEKRLKLADLQSLSLNGLRLKIFRLRKHLDDCVRGFRKKIEKK